MDLGQRGHTVLQSSFASSTPGSRICEAGMLVFFPRHHCSEGRAPRRPPHAFMRAVTEKPSPTAGHLLHNTLTCSLVVSLVFPRKRLDRILGHVRSSTRQKARVSTSRSAPLQDYSRVKPHRHGHSCIEVGEDTSKSIRAAVSVQNTTHGRRCDVVGSSAAWKITSAANARALQRLSEKAWKG
jgi:hypothetical protein